MSKNSIDREEMIMRLTDIYQQFEKVESLLNSNISHTKKWQLRTASRIRTISHRVSVIERKDIFKENTSVKCQTNGLEYQRKIKLTLGY